MPVISATGRVTPQPRGNGTIMGEGNGAAWELQHQTHTCMWLCARVHTPTTHASGQIHIYNMFFGGVDLIIQLQRPIGLWRCTTVNTPSVQLSTHTHTHIHTTFTQYTQQ